MPLFCDTACTAAPVGNAEASLGVGGRCVFPSCSGIFCVILRLRHCGIPVCRPYKASLFDFLWHLGNRKLSLCFCLGVFWRSPKWSSPVLQSISVCPGTVFFLQCEYRKTSLVWTPATCISLQCFAICSNLYLILWVGSGSKNFASVVDLLGTVVLLSFEDWNLI